MRTVARIRILQSISIDSASIQGFLNIPNRGIEGGDAEDVPLSTDPTPKPGIPIYALTGTVFQENKDECWYEGQSKTADQVGDLHFGKTRSVEAVVEGEIDVERHSKCPKGISRHEPIGTKCMSTKGGL